MKNLAIAREAVKNFNLHWVEAFSSLLAPDATYTDESAGITVRGTDEIKRRTAELRSKLPRPLQHTEFEADGKTVIARASVAEPGDFLEVMEFDDEGRIVKLTARYGDFAVVKGPLKI